MTHRASKAATGLREASGVRRQSEAATALSAAGDVREQRSLPQPKRCRASLATALQTLREQDCLSDW